MEKLLLVDDNEEILNQLKWGLSKKYFVLLAGSTGDALALFRKHKPKVVTLDMGLPPHEETAEEGLRCLSDILQESSTTKVVVVTGNEDRENALAAVQAGAYDYYKKPIDINELKVIVDRAFHLCEIEDENRRLQNVVGNSAPGLGEMMGQSVRMEKVFSTIKKIASTDISVLIQGDSGTGKELAARAIHELSLRKDNPFIAINCGAIPEQLLESELFGHEKGAFTGAHSKVQGKVEYAHKGTLFLDEIGELPAVLQVKLLRFLQEKTIQRVGGRDDIIVDTRIVAATNSNILNAIEKGTFREDLYYRLGVINVHLPPLKDRNEDIPLLAKFFLNKFSREYRKNINKYSDSAMHFLRTYDWPGNVRELENRIQRAILMTESSVIDMQDLSPNEVSTVPESSFDGGQTLREARENFERRMVHAAIERNRGNMTKAAAELGISRPTLYDMSRKYKLQK